MTRGRFVGIGVGTYESVPALQHATSDVRLLHALLKGFEGEPLLDATEQEIRTHLRSVYKNPRDGALVALWSGHAVPSGGKLRLLAKDNDGTFDGVLLDDFVSWCVGSGAQQLLIIIDACYAGTDNAEALQVVAALQEELIHGQPLWAGLLVSCSDVETARDGLFGDRLRRILQHGPVAAADLPRWSEHVDEVDGESLGVALLGAWDSDVQRPRFLRTGLPRPMLLNPRHPENAPARVVKHLLLAARGGDSADGKSWFTGRTDEVDTVVRWVRSGQPGLRVVTGEPGSGKSAIVGRVVSLSNEDERARLLQSGHVWQHTDPGPNSVQAHVHVRAMDANRVADLLSKQLVAAKRIPPPEGPRRDAAELVGVLQQAALNKPGGPPPVLVIDGLDEARGESFTIASTLLTKLAPHCTVVVATRQAHRAAGGAPLLTELAAVETLDLDKSGSEQDVHDYVLARVGDEQVARKLQDLPFLTAWMLTDQLLATPGTDPSTSLGAAFDAELAKVPAARPLLTALTWSFGAGFPESEWIAVASALASQELTRDDVTAVLTELGRHVVQDGEEGSAVYKLTHQSFADHLRDPFQPSRDCVFAPQSAVVAGALIRQYTTLIDSGVPADAPGYLWKYAWRHCGHAGPDALEGLRELARKTDLLVPDIALAAMTSANELTHWGRPVEAISPLEEAADHFRELVPSERMYLADLAYVLNRLGQRYRDAGKQHQAVTPAEEAVVRYRELVARTPTTAETLTHKRLAQRVGRSAQAENLTYVPHLSGALVDLSETYAQVSRRDEALAAAREAVALIKPLGSSPVHQPPYAKALRCLASRCSENGLRFEAMQRSRSAAALYEELARSNPAFLSDQASALLALSRDYGALDRLAYADLVILKAAELGEQLGEDISYRPVLVESLLSLSNAYSVVGRTADALDAAERAVTIVPDHGPALLNLTRRYRDCGRPADSLGTGLKAIEVFLLPGGRLSDVFATLLTLDVVCARLDQPDVVDSLWHRVLSHFEGAHAATLLMLRAANTLPGDPDAGEWLRAALVKASTSRQIIGHLHDLARRHFDLSGVSPWPVAPPWMTVDRALLLQARRWVHSPTYQAERAELTPALLSPDADVAVSEALLGVSISEAQNLQSRRATAQTSGVHAAYRPVLLASLADEFLDATPARRGELLRQHGDDLLDKEVRRHVRGNKPAHALLMLAADSPDLLPSTLAAVEDPSLAPRLLHDLAGHARPEVLEEVGLALGPHPDAPLFRAVARVLVDDERAARTFVRGTPHSRAWIIALTDMVPARPELLSLIRIVAEESP